MTNTSNSNAVDAASPEAIQARADVRLTKRIKYLENELKGKCALIAKLGDDAASAQRQAADEIAHLRTAVVDANTRIKQLETEVADARGDAEFAERQFRELINALRVAKSGTYDHLANALRAQRPQQ